MKKYELMYIVNANLDDAAKQELITKMHAVLTDNGATIVNEENWGLRKLAYPIQKKSTGFYTLVEFDAEPKALKKLETAFRRDERVLRFLTFRLDKYAAEYAAKRRSLKASKANAPKEVKED